MIRKLLLTTALLTFMGTGAFAQSNVTVRSGQHDTHTRVVFDWPGSTTYEVSESTPGQIVIKFRDPATLDMSGVKNDSIISGVSAAGQSATLNVAAGSTFRHFLVGNKIIVDVFKAGEQSQSPAVKAAAIEEKKPDVKPETATLPPPVSNAGPAVQAEAVPTVEKTAIESAFPPMEPHVITMSATEGFGLAAFAQNGYLWLVTDRASAAVPPQIAGPKASIFPKFDRFDIPGGGIAYTMKIPNGVAHDIRAEGGGLVWRVIIPTSRKADNAAKLDRKFAAGQTIRGGTAHWPLTGVTKILDVINPMTGDKMKVVTVEASNQFTGAGLNFVDFDMLKAAVGAVIVSKVDDLTVTSDASGLNITRPAGLAMSREKDVNRRGMREDVQNVNPMQTESVENGIRRIFDFDKWMMGGLTALNDNERILKAALPNKEPQGRIQDLLTMAKMNVSNDRGQEGLGYLSIAIDEMPQMADNLEFLALRGAAYALAGKPELAWKDLSNPGLNDFTELGYWKAFTLAGLEDWDQAYQNLPKDIQVLAAYPRPLLEKMGVKLSETALRGGDFAQAEKILALLERDRSVLKPWTLAGLDYLRGESARQVKDIETATKLWTPLIESKDRLYRARAGLALTMLELQEGKIDKEKAIDRLEGLRYAWRGDELEAQINYMLGRLYLEQDRYVKGFAILRDASTMALPDSNIGKEITSYMASSYQELLVQDKDLSPLDAATIYEEFKELTPPGEAGNIVIQRLAERLVEVDLLDRATALLQHQVDYRLQGADKARVAIRLAGIYLIDKNPRPAIAALDTAEGIYAANAAMTDAERKERIREVGLLRARALSKINRTEESIALLNGFDPDPDVNALRADIAWQAGLWEDAGEALQDLILDEGLDLNRPLTLQQADLVLNRAVALNLASNRVGLANMRTEYETAMGQTSRGRLFDIITRPRKVSTLSDRETIAGIVSEVDLFSGFLDSYRKTGEGDTVPAPVAPPAAAVPVAVPAQEPAASN